MHNIKWFVLTYAQSYKNLTPKSPDCNQRYLSGLRTLARDFVINSNSKGTMANVNNSIESYCTFTLAGDVTTGGLPGEAQIRKQLEDSDPQVSPIYDSAMS